MNEKEEIDTDLISQLVWWAEMRATGNHSGVEECTTEERPILENGLVKIHEYYLKIEAELKEMEACEVFAWDRCLIRQWQEKKCYDSQQLNYLRSQGPSVTEQLIELNKDENRGVVKVEEAIGSSTSPTSVESLIVGMALADYEKFGSNCFGRFHDDVFICYGFLMAVNFSHEAAILYLQELSKYLFEECDSDVFAEVLMKLYRRRQELKDEVP
ncbi:MAG: hypothetical protein K0U86_08660 [Planctomycetes bacterium]|nr:hypothetical protein [Planctomycetota bacterium]MCH9724961.1 hypothetical protein [Planctomycetota bacterium]MCH9777578.1 hypothetical protein [Planctomycetota bacterium]MCH9793456.1 hypothetical protein [Planctomycetota bacterium]